MAKKAKRAKEKEKVQKVKKIKKSNEINEKNTKDEKINFDEEIFIGLKRLDEDKPKTNKKKNKKNAKNKIKYNDKKNKLNSKEKLNNNENWTSKKQKTKKRTNKVNKKEGLKEKERKAKTNIQNAEQEENIITLENIQIIGSKKDDEQNKENKKKVKKNKTKVNKNRANNINQERNNSTQKKVKQKILTPKEKLAKKKRMAIFRIIKWFTLLGIIIGGTIYALLSPIFNIKTISVMGNSKISIDEIISLSGLQLEQNMFKYKTEDVIKKIKENAYIDEVKVSRKIPDTVEIIVVERKESFIIQFANAYAYINNQGYILEISDKKQELPLITGIQTEQEDIQVGKRLCKEDLKKLGDVLKIVEASISNDIYDLITKIDITNQNDYILTLQKKKKVVYLGDTSNLSTKMLWILTFNELEGNTEGEIILNMNLNDENNKPYFRKKV